MTSTPDENIDAAAPAKAPRRRRAASRPAGPPAPVEPTAPVEAAAPVAKPEPVSPAEPVGSDEPERAADPVSSEDPPAAPKRRARRSTRKAAEPAPAAPAPQPVESTDEPAPAPVAAPVAVESLVPDESVVPDEPAADEPAADEPAADERISADEPSEQAPRRPARRRRATRPAAAPEVVADEPSVVGVTSSPPAPVADPADAESSAPPAVVVPEPERQDTALADHDPLMDDPVLLRAAAFARTAAVTDEDVELSDAERAAAAAARATALFFQAPVAESSPRRSRRASAPAGPPPPAGESPRTSSFDDHEDDDEQDDEVADDSSGGTDPSRDSRFRRTPHHDSAAVDSADDEDEDEEAEEDGGEEDSAGDDAPRRRRRRGGRGRRSRPSRESEDAESPAVDDAAGTDEDDEAPSASADTSEEEDADAAGDDDDAQDGDEETAGSSRRRRRRRRRGGSAESGEEPSPDDPPNTVVRVREPRRPAAREPRGTGEDEITALKGSTRLEAKKQRRREGREQGRKRTILTEAEFLARRESVERVMVIRESDGRTQIGVLEDSILVEHYGALQAQTTMVGNVYLGRVQNVLPSMEAAFIDVGKGRNAVLYAGEVNWDAAGLEGQPRRIEAALKSGDSVLVQVTKDPVGHKGARLTSQVSLPGRYLVYVPRGSMTGISRKLPDVERTRLKKVLKKVVPEGAGVIVRTAAEGVAEEELAADVQRLQATWEAIDAKAASKNSPVLLHGEPDLTVRVVRDVFNEDFTRLVVSGATAWETVSEYVADVAPDLAQRLERWESDQDVFEAHRIDEQLQKALGRKVWLPSGGSLVIDPTEAMHVVDVNTGKFTGTGGTLEETVTRNNLEAAEEIVRQLRLRDIGGIIVIDFIDMVLESNRDLVLRRLVECLGRDRTKHQVAEVTSLGLVQMTRKRTGQGLAAVLEELEAPVPAEQSSAVSSSSSSPSPASGSSGSSSSATSSTGNGRGRSGNRRSRGGGGTPGSSTVSSEGVPAPVTVPRIAMPIPMPPPPGLLKPAPTAGSGPAE